MTATANSTFGATREFSVVLRVDTPIIEGAAPDPFGTSRRVLDRLYAVRPTALRGLIHTFARALFAPLLANEDGLLLRAERYLVGAQGGMKHGPKGREKEYGSTFTLTVSRADGAMRAPVEVRPGRSYKEDAYRIDHPLVDLGITPHAWALADDPHLAAMLCTVLWCGLSFGGIGLRSRRGYGSLTIATIDPEPVWPGSDEAVTGQLPAFPAPPDSATLRTDLERGLAMAQARARGWLTGRGFGPKLASSPTAGDAFFQMAGWTQVRVGKIAFGGDGTHEAWWVAMKQLMDACSVQKHAADKRRKAELDAIAQSGRQPTRQEKDQPDEYTSTLGGIKPRLASPLWVRLYRTRESGQEAWVSVSTLGAGRLGSATSPEPMTGEILAALDAPPQAAAGLAQQTAPSGNQQLAPDAGRAPSAHALPPIHPKRKWPRRPR